MRAASGFAGAMGREVMKTIGMIGGMSWESSAHYYRIINQETRARAGGQHSARVVMVSVDFAEVARLQHAGDWPALARLMAGAARGVEAGGADMPSGGTLFEIT